MKPAVSPFARFVMLGISCLQTKLIARGLLRLHDGKGQGGFNSGDGIG